MQRASGFTLIELLIAVAIIAILAAIAVPNLLEAQTRSKVARVRADHRALAIAIEAYATDRNAYPSANSEGSLKWLRWITTPVAYIGGVDLPDPFTEDTARTGGGATTRNYRYYGGNEMGYVNADTLTGQIIPVYAPAGTMKVFFHVLFSHGPDRVRSKGSNGATFLQGENLFDPARFSEFIYDPTNGTVSNGEILRAGGEIVGRAEPAIRLIRP